MGGEGRPQLGTANWELGTLLSLVLCLILLSGCVSGEARDQEPIATREATIGAVIDDVQATNTAKRFKLPTPTPEATTPPAPKLAQLVIATSVDGSGAPTNQVGSVSRGAQTTVYAAAQISNLREGQEVIASWRNVQGGVFAESSVEIDQSTSRRWVALRVNLDGTLPPGNYAVFIFVDEVDSTHELGSLVFRIN